MYQKGISTWFWRMVALLLVSSVTLPVSADIGMGESTVGLAPDSSLWELNRDASGTLYISDYQLPAVVTVNPATGSYTRYRFDPFASPFLTPGDAKPDGSGFIWWSDYFSTFGRINPSTNQVTYWNLSGLSLKPGGFVFDSSGRVWFTQPGRTRLLRFNPTNNELCQFEVGGGGNYLIAYGGQLWISDSYARRILRFDPSNNRLRTWALPWGSAKPEGLTFDADGRLWWADSGVNRLGYLSPNTNEAVTYGLTAGAQPLTVVPGIEVVWYTDLNGYIGFLDPALASGSPVTLTSSTSTALSSCSTINSSSQSLVKTVGTFSFPTVNWVRVTGTPAGITVYAPPGTLPLPYGMAFSDSRIWTVDQNRLTLSRTPRVPLAPAVSISLGSGNLTLSWAAVTQDEGGGSVTVSSYQVWRSNQPYFRPWDAGVTLVGTPSATSISVGAAPAAGQSAFFGVRSVASSRLLSRTSARVGAFCYELVPGTP